MVTPWTQHWWTYLYLGALGALEVPWNLRILFPSRWRMILAPEVERSLIKWSLGTPPTIDRTIKMHWNYCHLPMTNRDCLNVTPSGQMEKKKEMFKIRWCQDYSASWSTAPFLVSLSASSFLQVLGLKSLPRMEFCNSPPPRLERRLQYLVDWPFLHGRSSWILAPEVLPFRSLWPVVYSDQTAFLNQSIYYLFCNRNKALEKKDFKTVYMHV